VWTPREFQTVGAAAQNALAANDIAAGCCYREELKLNVEFKTDGNREFHTVGTPAVQTAVPYTCSLTFKFEH